MRDLPVIREAWEEGGPFIGDLKPVTRVTIQSPWSDLAGTSTENNFLRTTTSTGLGSSTNRGVPMRWWQDQANSHDALEVPNISSVDIDRSIDQDAATFRLTLNNQWMYVNGAVPGPSEPGYSVLGQPGFFTQDRGDSPEANARWGHEENEWHNYFVPNALLRVYSGFGGGYPTDIADAVSDGNLALYGVFLIDDVSVSTDGKITISGRDMAKLLIDQQLFPPLVPDSEYPLSYFRWKEDPFDVRNADKYVTTTSTTSLPAGRKTTIYNNSSLDEWYGWDKSIYGHRGSHSVDGDTATYALGPGNSGPDKPFATDFWEYRCGEQINGIYLHPWAGNYTLYVSVYENGAWQGSETIPYDASHLFATQSPAVDTGADVKYVATFTVPWETAREYVLPRIYDAELVRITFRNLTYSGLGTWKYRAGVREFANLGLAADDAEITTTTSGVATTYIQAAGGRYLEDKPYSFGYLTASRFNQQDAYGDARRKSQTHTDYEFGDFFDTPGCVRFTPDGEGYYVLRIGGAVDCYGTATFYGSPYTTEGWTPGGTPNEGLGNTDDGYAWDMALTPTGNGYWILNAWDTTVFAYGDATDHGPALSQPVGYSFTSMDSHPSADGYWVLRADGRVLNRGAATHYGNVPTTGPDALRYEKSAATGLAAFVGRSEQAHCIRSTSTGNGYWIMTTKGRVLAFGDAVKSDPGQPAILADHAINIFTESYWELIPGPDDRGYLIVHADGTIVPFGDIDYFGSAKPGGIGFSRSDGNYLDYSDIWRDLLLWSGFLLYDPGHPSNVKAPLFAGIESTGAFAKHQLPDEIFDKKPVIDAITELREAMGYLFRVDQIGRPIIASSNTWHFGNFNEDGLHVEQLLDIDEKRQLTNYAVSTNDTDSRSKIIISSYDPYADLSGTVTTNYVPPSAAGLRGIVKPAMWINAFLDNPDEQRIMAELIGLQTTFQERLGQVTISPCPIMLDLDDQVRIYERQSNEAYVHYVRGISFSHDLDSGAHSCTLTTHWLGEGRDSGDVFGEVYPVSDELQQRIADQQFGKYQRDPGGTI